MREQRAKSQILNSARNAYYTLLKAFGKDVCTSIVRFDNNNQKLCAALLI
jgi:hypothetical protein